MIRLTCTNCKATLEMDDAFAGGVCRCRHCGTIQTVPSHLKKSGTAPQPAGAKTLYQSHPSSPGPGTGTGLDELADIVASSGLSGTGLQNRRGSKSGSGTSRTPPAAAGHGSGAIPAARGAPPQGTPPQEARAYSEPQPQPRRAPSKLPYILAGAGGAALLCAVLAFFLFRGGGNTDVPGKGGTTPGGTPTVAGPRFIKIPLTASRVVYVIDCGASSNNVFDPLKNALYQSLKSLGPEREFQVIFWKRQDSEEPPVAFPEAGTARATPDQIAACQRRFADETPGGRTQVDEAIQLAMARNPDAIVIATAKQYELDETFQAAVDKARGSTNVQIHTVDLSGSPTDALKDVAQKTGGRHLVVSRNELESL